MSKTSWVLSVLLLVVLAAAPAGAGEADEASTEILRDTLRSNKKALVAVNLALSDEEARAFWPVYDRYQAELTIVGDRLLQVIDDYTRTFGSTTDDEAHKLVGIYLAVQRDRVALLQAYVEPFAEVLPGRTLMRFYQIENKIHTVMLYELAASIPVIAQ
ncbi:MAG: hypothetical protein JRG90_19705 [Deltaproteobacteria bacterium]|nr:hypothetical protein [Deltaproteobacteria bacterium]